jgi:TolB-like protein
MVRLDQRSRGAADLRYLFEDFTLDTDRRELWRGASLLPVEPQVFDLLAYLVQHRDRVVTKDELFAAVWNGRVVSDSALTTRINAARVALGDSGEAQRLIRTLRRRGIRFTADVQAPMEARNGAAAGHLPAVPDQPSIAVLPFDNPGNDPTQEYFADGMVDDILMSLSKVRWLFVIARYSSFCYKGRTAIDVREVGRELGVRYVVQGSVRKSSNRVRIHAQLIDAQSGAYIWTDRFESDWREIFALQDEITERLVAGVEASVRAAEIRRASAKPTDSLTAYDLYLRGLSAFHGPTEADYQRTGALLRQTIEVDPHYAEALGILTDHLATRTLQGWHESWALGVDESVRFARRAVAAGPDNSTCLASAAFVHAVLAHGFDEAVDLADRALAIHPNSAFVRNRAASAYVVCGENDKAIAHCEAARRMNPLDSRKQATTTAAILSCACYFAGRYQESIEAGKRALAFTPTNNTARKFLAASLAQLGRLREAQAEIAELCHHQPDASVATFALQPFRHRWMKELHVEGLRKAGLREE